MGLRDGGPPLPEDGAAPLQMSGAAIVGNTFTDKAAAQCLLRAWLLYSGILVHPYPISTMLTCSLGEDP